MLNADFQELISFLFKDKLNVLLNIFVNYLSDHISRSESEMVDLEGRQPVLLYVQGHMDTLLILVLDSLSRATKDNINKLVRCLLL